MKIKTILLIFFVLIVLVFAGWLFFRNSDTPIVETIRSGLPFGTGDDINIPALGDPSTELEASNQFDENITSRNKLFRISNTPVAGFVILNDRVRYVDRATGHIFDTIIPTASIPLEKIRVTNNTMPKIYEAHFRSDGSMVLLRSLDEDSGVVKNLTLTLIPPSTTSTSSPTLYSVSATNLRGDIDSPLPGTGNSLYYVARDIDSIVSSTFVGSNLRTLFNSEFDNWRLARAGNNLLVYTKASAGAPGYGYLLNQNGGILNKILGPLEGLTAVSNLNGGRIIYSYIESGITRLFVRNQSGDLSEILPTTLAEKCVWSISNSAVFYCGTPIVSPSAGEPDNWYLGRTHFSDYIWQFDTNSEIARLVIDPKTDFGIDLDVYKPNLSPNENYLVFINKRDMTLWAAKLQ